MMEISLILKEMDMEFIFSKIKENMKANSKMENSMVKENMKLMERHLKENGLMEFSNFDFFYYKYINIF